MISRKLRLVALLLLARSSCRAIEVQPLFSAELLGGQYLNDRRSSSLSGNAAGLAAPAVFLNDRWTLLPSLSSRYQGTKQVRDLVGGGTLFSERMDHRLALRGVYQPEESKWRFKPSLGYGVELLKETLDENWGRGLFDARTVDVGIEAEYVFREPYSVRASFDVIHTEFPNYEALESKVSQDFLGGALKRELSQDRVLDHRALMFALSATLDAAGFDWGGRVAINRQSFGRQAVVGSDGQLSSESRSDFIVDAEVSGRREFEVRPGALFSAGLGLGVRGQTSNQNAFDARRLVYQAGYYNGTEWSLRPAVELGLGDERSPVKFSLRGRWARRRYPHRRVQDDSGAYGSAGLVQDEWSMAVGMSYPMAPRLRLMFNAESAGASSNQGFEQFYSYGWSASSILIGLRFDY